MNARVSELLLAGPAEAADLGGYLSRLLRFDKAAAVRVVASGSAVGVYGQPPFDVLTLRTVALGPGEAVTGADIDSTGIGIDITSIDIDSTGITDTDSIDITVSAGDLLHAIADDGSLALPRPLAGATAWTGFLPPRVGWQATGELPVAEVETAALAGIAEFKERAEAIPDRERTRASVDGLAAEIWDRPLSFGLSVRAAHAARAMAFLGQAQSASVVVRSAGRWLRLDAPFGTVVVRTGTGLLAG
ncbi:hypothetical protein KGQ20_44355 [Catenulispora sp. NF23]|uniref:FAD-binding PCMH-type domain-containing protein n=1 Tax=Catenulispora pinistramenti TaxID=2705254 RepID=A0ABS5KUU9_9ACTN|nr:hypothetical protein [Catenulispora pinistramenti]MBS2539797.1 hypothetical protein [Catenulispora pinistramenti]MBS2549779.1 hypothetical protein [Catenulispora pinistramenti]